MPNAVYNPLRRNRNIGTSRQGHGRNNSMKIPSVSRDDRIWWEVLGPHTLLKRTINHGEITFIVEQTREDCRHACTVDDICHLLSLVPASDLESLNTIVLRQPTRKQRLIEPVWGRLAYSADLGRAGKKTRHLGPAIFLEAVNPQAVWQWSKSLDPLDVLEVERLKTDGHVVEDTGKLLVFRSTLESTRNTQLYRTLLHEIGHWVDWLEKVIRPERDSSASYDLLSDRYFARPKQERELFAHRYADALRKRLIAEVKIPFS